MNTCGGWNICEEPDPEDELTEELPDPLLTPTELPELLEPDDALEELLPELEDPPPELPLFPLIPPWINKEGFTKFAGGPWPPELLPGLLPLPEDEEKLGSKNWSGDFCWESMPPDEPTGLCCPLDDGCEPLEDGCEPLDDGWEPPEEGCELLPPEEGCEPLDESWKPPEDGCKLVELDPVEDVWDPAGWEPVPLLAGLDEGACLAKSPLSG